MLDLYVLDFNVKQNSLDENVINVMPYLCSQGKVDALKILLKKPVRDGRAAEVFHGQPGKGVLCPFGDEGKLRAY